MLNRKIRLRGPLRDHTGLLGGLRYEKGVATVPYMSDDEFKGLLTYHERCWQAEEFDDRKVQASPERPRPVPEVHGDPPEECEPESPEPADAGEFDAGTEVGETRMVSEGERYSPETEVRRGRRKKK